MAFGANHAVGDPILAAHINAIETALNAEFVIPLYLASSAWAIPASTTELFGGTTRRLSAFDLSTWYQVRISRGLSAAAAAGAVMKLQYTTTLTPGTSTGWTDLSPTVGAATVDAQAGSWGSIPAGAQTNVQIRVVGSGGDGTTSATVQAIFMHLKR